MFLLRVTIVGRLHVGESSLFDRIAGRRVSRAQAWSGLATPTLVVEGRQMVRPEPE